MKFIDILLFSIIFTLYLLPEAAMGKRFDPETRKTSRFDSLAFALEKNVLEDSPFDLRLSIFDSMKAINSRIGSFRTNLCLAYWEYTLTPPAQTDQRLRLLDSLEHIAESIQDNYILHKIRLSKSSVLRRMGQYPSAYQLASDAENYFKKNRNLLQQASAEVHSGTILYEIGDYESAVRKLENACRHYQEAGFPVCATKNQLNLSNALYFQGEREQSIEMLRNLAGNPISRADTVFLINVMISLINISDYQYDSYIDTALNLAKQSGISQLILLTHFSKGKKLMLDNRNDSALACFQTCQQLFRTKRTDLIHALPVLSSLAQAHARLGHSDSAYIFLNQYITLKDSILDQGGLMDYQRAEMKMAIDAARTEAKLQKEKNRLQRNITYIIISTLVIIAGMGFYILSLSRKKERISKQLKEAELREAMLKNQQISCELDSKNRELMSNILLITEKNNALKQILESTEQKLQQHKIPYQEGNQLVFQLKSLLNESNEWIFFKQHFESVHPQFFRKLKETCPYLSENELRICAIIRIGMSNKEIAKMIGIEAKTIFTIRYRIRKKIFKQEASSESSLEDFLRSI